MIKKVSILFAIIFLVFLVSCKSTDKNTDIYFGGKIINPKNSHVILYAMEEVVDTFFLDANNKFIGKVKKANEGLYYFSHGNENQHIYLEPGDSLMLRLNTWDFDESLVFAGKGAERNNVLIDCFLDTEKDKKLFYQYNQLEPAEFNAKADSLLQKKIVTYNEYIKTHSFETSGFNEILKIALTYPIYSRIEKYPIIHAKITEKNKLPEVETSFYDYRKQIKKNSDSLMYYPPYSRYIRNYLYNETFTLGHNPLESEYSSEFTLDLLNTINDKVSTESSKNAFLRQTVIGHFYNKSSCSINLEAFNTFFKLSTNEKDKKIITNLIDDSQSIIINEDLPQFAITDYANTEHSISDVIKDQNAFLFFWSPEFVSESYIVSRFQYLSKTYPNIQFIEIKINGDKNKRIQKLDIKNQFYLADNSAAHEFLTCKMPRSVLVNKKGKVVNGYASISSNNLTPFLNKLNKN
ncbi:hypothetical protein [Polaribacter sp. Hel_I_88]|uniref:TlpA family protein disulfide reductase n=1 Tax=Polaribacter sp. Hel_I_88 TaxID=1250006 RepID=UPI00047AFB2D|nr:hypothetical protein [Polaribacter sp. Hel_I_88]